QRVLGRETAGDSGSAADARQELCGAGENAPLGELQFEPDALDVLFGHGPTRVTPATGEERPAQLETHRLGAEDVDAPRHLFDLGRERCGGREAGSAGAGLGGGERGAE